MQIYDCPASSIQHAAAQAGVRLPAASLAPKGGRRPYYSLTLRTGIPAFLDALFVLAPAAEVRTAWGRYRGAADWQANRRRERLVGEYEAGGIAQAAAWLRGEGARPGPLCVHGLPDGMNCLVCDTDGAAEACGFFPTEGA